MKKTPEIIYNKLTTIINSKELAQLYPNGFISFLVKYKRNDAATTQLLKAAGLNETN